MKSKVANGKRGITTIDLQPQVKAKLLKLARAEKRSLNNYLNLVLADHVKRAEERPVNLGS